VSVAPLIVQQPAISGHVEVAPLLAARGVSRRYGPIAALADVSIEFLPGEVHAVVGENGAGKSTLMRLLAGEEQPDRGTIIIDGQPAALSGPNYARVQGIAVVHQCFQLVEPMTVAENLFLGQAPTRARLGPIGVIDRRRMRREAARRLADFGLAGKVGHRIRDLTVAERQLVEIARAMDGRARVLILDEPTASLGAAETAELFRHVAAMRSQGAAIILIAHNIDEVMAVADRISVLRNGRLIATQRSADINYDALVRMIVGRELSRGYPKVQATRGETMLHAGGLVASGAPDRRSIEVRGSEIVGIPTYIGAMVDNLLAMLAGASRMRGMLLRLAARDITGLSLQQRVAAGLCLVPGDVMAEGLIPSFSIEDNILLPNLRRFRAAGMVRRRALRDVVNGLIRDLDIKPADPTMPVKNLSGGNRQKIVIAKWLASGARVYLMNDPTKSVDVGAKAEIYRLLGKVVTNGGAVLLVSSDTDELIGLADRVLVLRGAQIVEEFPQRPIAKDRLLAAVVGSRRAKRPLSFGPSS
jgi:ABC-type sugar transport system ATPase subunit